MHKIIHTLLSSILTATIAQLIASSLLLYCELPREGDESQSVAHVLPCTVPLLAHGHKTLLSHKCLLTSLSTVQVTTCSVLLTYKAMDISSQGHWKPPFTSDTREMGWKMGWGELEDNCGTSWHSRSRTSRYIQTASNVWQPDCARLLSGPHVPSRWS